MRSNAFTCHSHMTYGLLVWSIPLSLSFSPPPHFTLAFQFCFFQSLVHISLSLITVFFPWSRSLSTHPKSSQSFSLSYQVMVPVVSTDTTSLCTDWPPFAHTDWPLTQLFLSFPVHLLLITFLLLSVCTPLILFTAKHLNLQLQDFTTNIQ